MAALQALPHLVADFPLVRCGLARLVGLARLAPAPPARGMPRGSSAYAGRPAPPVCPAICPSQSRPALAGLFRPNSLATLVSEPPPHTPSEQAMMQQRHQGGSQLYGLPYLAQQHRQAPDRPLIGLATRPEYDAPPAPSYGLEVLDGSDVQDSLAAANEADGGEETDYTCHICRKVFKREMNLVFHMTTHRPKQPQEEAPGGDGTEVISCQDCGKMFGTKYQAKKHYLRRHFQGERPFPCNKCGKRFVVREDLTMHAKSCGNVYTCGSCNVRLCSLGALKRHCKHFNHTALSHEPLQDNMVATVGAYYPQQPSGQLTSAAGARGF